MAAAAVDRTADPQIAEAVDGAPNVTVGPGAGVHADRRRRAAPCRWPTCGARPWSSPSSTRCAPPTARSSPRSSRSTNALLGADAAQVRFVAVVANPVYRSAATWRPSTARRGWTPMANWTFLTGSLAELAVGVERLRGHGADGAGRRHGGPRRHRLRDRRPRHAPPDHERRPRVGARRPSQSSFSGLLAAQVTQVQQPGPAAVVSRRTWLVVGVVLVAAVVVVVARAPAASAATVVGTADGRPPSARRAGRGVHHRAGRVAASWWPWATSTTRPTPSTSCSTGRAGSTSWMLATPPGVADNGGLVRRRRRRTGTLTAGFLPVGRPDLLGAGPAGRRRGHVDAGGACPARSPRAGRPGHRADGGSAAVLRGDRRTAVVAAGPGLDRWHRLVDGRRARRRASGCPRWPRSPRCAVPSTRTARRSSGRRCAGSPVGRALHRAAPAGRWTAARPARRCPGVAGGDRRCSGCRRGRRPRRAGRGHGPAARPPWSRSGAAATRPARRLGPADRAGGLVGAGHGGRRRERPGGHRAAGLRHGPRRRVEVGRRPGRPARRRPPGRRCPRRRPARRRWPSSARDRRLRPVGQPAHRVVATAGLASWTRVARQSVPIQYGSSG